jgi:hypothetical protein
LEGALAIIKTKSGNDRPVYMEADIGHQPHKPVIWCKKSALTEKLQAI